MNILLIGSGGREHAMAWKIAQSSLLTKLYIAPGNAGTAALGENVNIPVDNFDAIGKFALEHQVDMVVVGPEDPLVNGIHDYFLSEEKLKHIAVIGPQKVGAQLEGSKKFAKEFMGRHGIPTARYKSFKKKELDEAYEFLSEMKPPYVLKADGLAAGKGVLILNSISEAKTELAKMFEGKFGEAGSTVVIEEFLKGIELSVFVLTDGKSYKLLPEAKDYKRVGEGDTGLNTGGMGSVSPVSFADKDFMAKVEQRIIQPTIKGLYDEHIPYKGFIFFGLINVEGNPYVIEYNVRMGDPETEVVMPRLKSDLVELFIGLAQGKLKEKKCEADSRFATAVMLTSGGYPGPYQKGKEIMGLEKVKDSLVFHAGTKLQDEKILTNGGRVLAITSFGDTQADGLKLSYKNADLVQFEGRYFRKDIGFDI